MPSGLRAHQVGPIVAADPPRNVLLRILQPQRQLVRSPLALFLSQAPPVMPAGQAAIACAEVVSR